MFLCLSLFFLSASSYLGLPKLGVNGTKKGDIDYMSFLLRFRPVNTLLDKDATLPSSDDGTARRHVSENLEVILEMLQKNRYELESLFRHFG